MKDLEQLVQYLDGELNEIEKQQLIEKLKKDPSLRERIDLIKDVDALIGDKQLEKFEESLKEVEAMYHKKKEVPAPATRKMVALQIAAAIIILVSAATYFLFVKNNGNTSSDELFAAYYQKLPADFTTRSEGVPNDGFVTAIQLYNENKYKEAITEFNKVVMADPSNNAAKLFLGICYTETQQFTNATNYFKKIIDQEDPIFQEHASWYLSLCYIKTHETGKARQLLSNLVSTRSFYMAQASELLKKLPKK